MDLLPCLTLLVASSLLTVGGEMAMEMFSGAGIMSMGLYFAAVQLFVPWDAKFGERFNVRTWGVASQGDD